MILLINYYNIIHASYIFQFDLSGHPRSELGMRILNIIINLSFYIITQGILCRPVKIFYRLVYLYFYRLGDVDTQ